MSSAVGTSVGFFVVPIFVGTLSKWRWEPCGHFEPLTEFVGELRECEKSVFWFSDTNCTNFHELQWICHFELTEGSVRNLSFGISRCPDSHLDSVEMTFGILWSFRTSVPSLQGSQGNVKNLSFGFPTRMAPIFTDYSESVISNRPKGVWEIYH